MKKQLFIFIILSLFFSCQQEDFSIKTISLNGTWQLSELGKDESLLGKVPSSVQFDLLQLQKIPHPFKQTNEDSIQWISEKNWEYKKEFILSENQLKKEKHILQFKGIDTYSEIYLNGHQILKTNNAFRTWDVNVSTLLKEKNELRIILFSVDSIEHQLAQQLEYTLPESPRVFTRKPQFQYGWDWGPKIKTLGIWKDVNLISYDEARILDVYYQIETLDNKETQLKINFEIESLKNTDFEIIINNKEDNESFTKKIHLKKGINYYSTTISIRDAKFWWPQNVGTPYHYLFEFSLQKNKTIIDSKNKIVGLRTVELISQKDSIGQSFYFKINGQDIYMKGANYIPQNIFLSEVTKKDKEQLIQDVIDANMNMLRIWGGGIYEDEEFYNLCDKKGILIWQDFMFACAMYPGDQSFLDNVKKEAIDNVKRLRNHPSIALWCGNNEMSEGWHRWGWQDGKTEEQKNEIWTNYQKVFNEILPQVVDSLHPSVSYWESSPKYGRGDKKYQFEGDAHDWWVWHDGYPFEHFEEEVPRFMSEFGFQSFPSYEAIKYFTEKDSFDFSDPSFTTHQKHIRGFQLIDEYMKRDFPVAKKPKDYIYMSQLVQAYGMSLGIEAHRRAKPYNMGTLYWQLNDCWPVISWSSIDGLGNWKALHYYVKRVFKNILISPYIENNFLHIKIINDNPNTLQNDLKIYFKDFNGNIIKEYIEKDIKIENKKNTSIFKIDLSTIKFDPKNTFAEIIFEDEKAIHYFEKPKNLSLPAKEINIKKEKTNEGFYITLNSKTLQKDVFLYTENHHHFEDNFFDLLPNQNKTIFVKNNKKPLEEIKIKTLN